VEHAEIEHAIREYLTTQHPRRAAEIAALDPAAPVFERGLLDSLSFIDFVTFLEGRFRFTVPTEEFHRDNFGTIAATTAFVSRSLGR
jgi:acyl carrier protein